MKSLHFRTKPWPHQVTALKFAVRNRRALIQVPMRFGKSWIGINWAAALYQLEDVRRVLVITVTSGLGVWEDQIMEHCPASYAIVDHRGQLLARNREDPELTFMIVNYQNLYSRVRTGNGAGWVPVVNQILVNFQAGAIIGDECHHLGNPGAEQSKQAYALARQTRFRLGLTGTAFHRKPFYVFGQVKFIDDGQTFGTAWTHFKKRIAVFGGYGNYEVIRYKNLKWMMDSLKPFTYIERKLPKRPHIITNRIRFNLTGKHAKAYEEMAVHRVLPVAGEVLTSDIVLTRHLRLMQIAGGFVKLSTGRYACVGTCKLEMFTDRLREYLEQGVTKAVVACRFLPELTACAKVGKKAGFQVILFHGGVPKGNERRRRTRAFQQAKKPTLFISQISTGKESIQLDAADTLLWYSLTESYVEYDQFQSRIERYNDRRPLQHDFLLARGTEDEIAYESMGLKMDVARFLTTQPRKAEAIFEASRGRKR